MADLFFNNAMNRFLASALFILRSFFDDDTDNNNTLSDCRSTILLCVLGRVETTRGSKESTTGSICSLTDSSRSDSSLSLSLVCPPARHIFLPREPSEHVSRVARNSIVNSRTTPLRYRRRFLHIIPTLLLLLHEEEERTLVVVVFVAASPGTTSSRRLSSARTAPLRRRHGRTRRP
jgi:hypothetical protein